MRVLIQLKPRLALTLLATIFFVAPAAVTADVETTGKIGSPGATTTIDGKQLPAPPAEFGGKIEHDALDSETWWPPTIAFWV